MSRSNSFCWQTPTCKTMDNHNNNNNSHHHHHQGQNLGSGSGIAEDDTEYYDDEQEDSGSNNNNQNNNTASNTGPPATEELEKNLDDASNLMETETGLFHQRMWTSFQNCARAIAQVYVSNKQVPQDASRSEDDDEHSVVAVPGGSVVSREVVSGGGGSSSVSDGSVNLEPCSSSNNGGGGSKPASVLLVEDSFKSAAQHATTLYKDSLETSRRLIDLAIKTGSNRRTKEVLAFVKSRKKRYIRKEELISFLVGGGSSSSVKKDTQVNGGGGGGRKHHHLGGISPAGAFLGNLFDGAYSSYTGLVTGNGLPQIYHVQQQQQQQQQQQIQGQGFFSCGVLTGSSLPMHHPVGVTHHSANSSNTAASSPSNGTSMYPSEEVLGGTLSSGATPLPPQSLPFQNSFTTTANPALFCPTTTPFSNPQSQRLSNNNNNSSSNNNNNIGVRSGLEEADPGMLHLAVQQLFVASGTTSSSSSSSSTTTNTNPGGNHHHHQYAHIAGVKRPAPNTIHHETHHHHHHHHSGDEDDVVSEDLSHGGSRIRTGCDLDDDDDMMEDSVDAGDASCNFKRMRFY